MARGEIKIDVQRCKGCGVCLGACPVAILALSKEVNGKGYFFAETQDPEKCTGCANCATVCPDGCIEVWRS